MSSEASSSSATFGVIGLAVMGRNLALNLADHGEVVAVWNRSPGPAAALGEEHKNIRPTASLAEFVASLPRPRAVLLMVKAGAATDAVIEAVAPLLDAGDVVIDGGNAWFEDTRRREAALRAQGLHFVGLGVSGGEEGARHGPSLMPGGSHEAWDRVRGALGAIAARSDYGPCVTHLGPDGAGHFVKMVHNGIEYADMQLIAEVYDLLRRDVGLGADRLAEVFEAWNAGPLASFLIEITAKIFTVRDPVTGGPLVDLVLDRAGQKGTGRWTAQVALDLGVPVPAIAAAVDARALSAQKDARIAWSSQIAGPTPTSKASGDAVADLHDALLAAKVLAYAQGMALLRAAGAAYDWPLPMAEIARIWTGGCIIRARLLAPIMSAFQANADLDNLLLDPALGGVVAGCQGALRRVVARAAAVGIPAPALSASLAWLDAVRTASLPQNLTQAQRDAFGAHTYVRTDQIEAGAVHSEWLG